MTFLFGIAVAALAFLLLTCVAGGMFWIHIGHPRDWLEERLPGRLTWRVRAPYSPDADTLEFVQHAGPAERVSNRRSA